VPRALQSLCGWAARDFSRHSRAMSESAATGVVGTAPGAAEDAAAASGSGVAAVGGAAAGGGAASGAGGAAEAPKDPLAEPENTTRRDQLRDLATKWQERWERTREFETDAGAPGAPKYLVTFPYPYMNGRLHLGHAFTVTKAEFSARYQRLKGKRVIFPFGFHCTGMPIQAAANKLRRELDGLAEEDEDAEGAEEEEAEAAAESAAAASAAPAAAGVAEGAAGPGGAKTDPTQFHSKRSKAVAKGGGGKVTQADILRKSGIPEEEIPQFRDPRHWLQYFPPLGKADLEQFGAAVDWRRSFITTDVNPYYDRFIQWQFRRLKAQDRVKYGTRPTIFSPLDGQACMDHDRAEGENVAPQEYTLIKIEVIRGADGALPGKLGSIDDAVRAARAGRSAADAAAAAGAAGGGGGGGGGGKPRVYLVAATLRPETMYGQTNCFVLPEGEYGAFETRDADEVFVCSARSARNMAFQDLSPKHGEVSRVGTFSGRDLMGLPLRAPNATFPVVYCLPLLTISMNKGTGVVTSVPSDAPDDYAALEDLRRKPALREKFGIAAEMVEPFEVVEIIEIPEFGRRAAVTVCEQMGIKSQNDRDKLREAKERVYTKGFYEGVMLVGTYAGKKVHEAKTLVRDEMIREGKAALYWEPDGLVISRSGDECVVAPLAQWYLNYGEPSWKALVEEHVLTPGRFETFTSATQSNFRSVLTWLREWACSRSFGLGTRLPWDPQFVIESLSDSTIYMAYYAVAHLLQGGALDGSATGPAGIRPEQLTDAVWDYIFVEGAYPADCGIPEETLRGLRREFEFWYPMDLRVSGKDLINNHLTMALYNHAAIWDGRADRMPRAVFANGHVLVNGKKMSKSLGNFILLTQGVKRFSPDALRLALADSGDHLDDANFETAAADRAILSLTKELSWATEMLGDKAALRRGSEGNDARGRRPFVDRYFEAAIDELVDKADQAYATMRFRDAVQFAFFNSFAARDVYRDMCARMGEKMHADCVRRFLEVQAIIIAPIVPHWSEEVWELLGHQDTRGSVTRAAWPTPGAEPRATAEAGRWLVDLLHAIRMAIDSKKRSNGRLAKTTKSAAPTKEDVVTLVLATEFMPWQRRALDVLDAQWDEAARALRPDAVKEVSVVFRNDAELRGLLKEAMKFAGAVATINVVEHGRAALAREPRFNDFEVVQDTAAYVDALLREFGVTRFAFYDKATAPKALADKLDLALPTQPFILVSSSEEPPIA
jgi:leucyl-tRNA synthetase